jgi:hypothetical protein
VALGITTLCITISLHALSISLNQDKAIHRELTAFQKRQIQAHNREAACQKRHEGSLSQFLADDKITLIDWVPDHLEVGCDTGVFLYTVTGEVIDSPTETPVYHRRRYEPDRSMWLKAEKFKYQQQALWTDCLLVEGIQGNVKTMMIDKDRRWTILSAALNAQPRTYALTTAGELRVYDARQDRLLQRYPLGEAIGEAQCADLRPDAWKGYLVTHTVVESPVVRQILWVALQHPECPNVMLWSLDISDPNRPLPDLHKSVSSVRVLSNQYLSARPIGIMHPHHHRAGLVLAAIVGGLPVMQWFERGALKAEIWSNDVQRAHFPWNRIMAIDRWQVGYPDRLYVFDTAGHIWRGNFFSDSSRKPLDLYCLHGVPLLGTIEKVKVVSGVSSGVDIVQQKLQGDKSIVSVVSDNLNTGEKIVHGSHAAVTFFIKSPHLWLFTEESKQAERFSLGSWHRHKHISLDASLPHQNSVVTTLLFWSPQAQNFIWMGLNNNLCEKTVKIQGEYANFATE